MKHFLHIVFAFLALILTVTSCSKNDDNNPTPTEEEKDYETVNFSLTATLTHISGNINGTELKSTFANDDIIEISNTQILYEPLILTSTDCKGKSSATFSGEMKVKKGASLSNTKLTAVLKNTNNKSLYNGGKPFNDVKGISSLADETDLYSYWVCENFAYNGDGLNINLVQNTVFVQFNIPFAVKVDIKNGQAVYSSIVSVGNCFAVPIGSTIECKPLKLEKCLESKDKAFYTISSTTPKDCLSGLFSIGEDKQVFFCKSNLQYRPLDGAWRLAENQYVKCFDKDVELSYDFGDDFANWLGEDKWTDLFRWGSWIVGGYPNKTGTLNDYQVPVDANNNLIGTCAFGSEWTVLSDEEWDYLFSKRTDASQKCGGALIDDIKGWVIVPDDFIAPDGIKPFEAPFDVLIENMPNKYTKEEWTKMESAGAVFLRRSGDIYKGYSKTTTYSYTLNAYQTKTYDDLNGYDIWFDELACKYDYHDKTITRALPIRLVQEATPTVKIE